MSVAELELVLALNPAFQKPPALLRIERVTFQSAGNSRQIHTVEERNRTKSTRERIGKQLREFSGPAGHQSLVLVSDNNFNPDQRTQFLAFEVVP